LHIRIAIDRSVEDVGGERMVVLKIIRTVLVGIEKFTVFSDRDAHLRCVRPSGRVKRAVRV
jgi:hypothetical protein